jgi:hypothetical protein
VRAGPPGVRKDFESGSAGIIEKLMNNVILHIT